jgi:hypothetical protein
MSEFLCDLGYNFGSQITRTLYVFCLFIYANLLGPRFFAPSQTGSGAHPASNTMYMWSFLGLKRPEPGVDCPHPSNAEITERVDNNNNELQLGCHPVALVV